MNKIILCEGETDAILLSYYLGKVAAGSSVRNRLQISRSNRIPLNNPQTGMKTGMTDC